MNASGLVHIGYLGSARLTPRRLERRRTFPTRNGQAVFRGARDAVLGVSTHCVFARAGRDAESLGQIQEPRRAFGLRHAAVLVHVRNEAKTALRTPRGSRQTNLVRWTLIFIVSYCIYATTQQN
ncbi:Hypothetical_protein [Hexamita inflata]|uniref:Hypothetical_protein n=1 Tax=Hexamita inflata TaxID=28002 RepID=A0AA86PW48_9EUKA|nr:Hypothetical protein HINF_LOCUS30085 [Hexamita inflata]